MLKTDERSGADEEKSTLEFYLRNFPRKLMKHSKIIKLFSYFLPEA